MEDEPVTKQDLASFKDFVVSQLTLHKSVISSEVQKSQEVASAALSASNSLKEQSGIKFTYIHSLFGNAGYRIRKTEVLMWTCLSTC